MNDYDIIMEALRRHNSGEMKLSDVDAEKLAMQAKAMGERFKVESKPLSKGAFDFADMATFGLLPDEWRPTSQGQNIFGESAIDRVAGGVGSVIGLGTGVTGGVKASKMGWNALKKAFARKKADDIATNIYKANPLQLGQGNPLSLPGRPTPQLPAGPNVPQLGQGSPLSLRGAPQQLGPAVRPGNVGRSLAEQQRRLEEAIAALRSNPYAQGLGVQQGGYIQGYQEGGMSDEDYQAMQLEKTGLLDQGENPWFGNIASVTKDILGERGGVPYEEASSDIFSIQEGAPQGTWTHQSERNGEVEDFIQPMIPTVTVRGTR